MRFTRQPVLKCWCALSSVLQVCVTSQLCVVVMACPHTMCCSCGWPKKKPFRKHEIYSSASFEIWCAPKLGFTGLCHISILCCTHGLSPTYCVAGVGGPKSILFKNIEVARKPFLQFLQLFHFPAVWGPRVLPEAFKCYLLSSRQPGAQKLLAVPTMPQQMLWPQRQISCLAVVGCHLLMSGVGCVVVRLIFVLLTSRGTTYAAQGIAR